MQSPRLDTDRVPGTEGLREVGRPPRSRRLSVAVAAILSLLTFLGVQVAGQQVAGADTIIGSGFSFPWGVAVDSSGNVYVADTNNSRVEEVTPGGVQTTIGSGFNKETGVAVDSSGNVYLADTDNNRIEEVTPGGVQTTIGSFSAIWGVAVDSARNLYLTTGSQVVKITPGGVQTTIASGLDGPTGVAVDAFGNVYGANSNNGQVVKITPGGVQTTIGSGFNGSWDVAVDSSGNVFVADLFNNRVEEVTPGGVQATIGSGFKQPGGVAVDSSGNVYVADTGNSRIVEVPPTPSIASFSPASGPVGTVVTLRGVNFLGATKVTVNGVTATIKADTATKIKITVPAGATTGKIKVFTPLGKAKTANVFTVT